MTNENITIEVCEMSGECSPNKINISIETSDFGFTRYLYIIDDVKSSLVMSILHHKLEESLFWAYELYFSGCKESVFCMLEQMVTLMYSKLHPRLVLFLEKKKRIWNETGSYCIIGTFIYNMIIRNYDICDFVKQFCKDPDLIKHVNESSPLVPVQNSRIYINVQQKDVAKYMTMNPMTPRNLLKKTVKYQIRKNTLAIFDHEHGMYSHNQLQSMYWNHWLYYGCASPIWKERIAKYNGTLDHENHRVCFENDETACAFYEKYNLEPDEQSEKIQRMNIGTGFEEQISWYEFYEYYKNNGEHITKSMK